MRSLIGSLALVAAFGSTARADILCHTVTAPPTAPTWSTTLVVPAFDPALGTLTSVEFVLTPSMTWNYGIESLDASPSVATLEFISQVDLLRPDFSSIVFATLQVNFVHSFTAFDGTIDFGGTSGVSSVGGPTTSMVNAALTSPSDLALFSGMPGAPGSIALNSLGNGGSSGTGGGSIVVHALPMTGIELSVCYDYTPVAAPFCAGDGTNTPCPCGNDSAVGANQGCLNSFGAGAALRGAGIASVASDSLVLTCSNLPSTTTGLFFQGTAQAGGGVGIAFGDGLQCAFGTKVRIGTQTASGGTTTYPEAGDAPISVRGSVPANSTRYYQFWYRNAANFCTPGAFNLSQGVAVTWSP